MTELSVVSRKHVTTVPGAIKALAAMERQLSAAKTYTEIRKVIDQASAIKLLLKDVDVVKEQAEDVILAASARIGEELEKVPKATNAGRGKSQNTQPGKLGRKDAMPSGTQRARFKKLAEAKPKLKKIAKQLREQGKDATPRAVVQELTHGDKRQRRATLERELGAKQKALPQKKYGVIVTDDEWEHETYSDKGKDRAAENHYPTSSLAKLKKRDIASIAAKDCVYFMWATVPQLANALELMAHRGFRYVSHYIWVKDREGTGYWNRGKHELLLIGTRGKIPCPAPGTQWPSAIEAPVKKHSEKPQVFLEMIETYYPNLPKIELNRRGPARSGWDAWGNEALEAAE
jgi:N6-adenosine-specific RNA methylase IME4